MITINGRDYKLIDAHFHIWNRMHGFRFKDVPSEPIGSGRVRVGTREYQFMAPSFTETTSPLEALEVEMDNCGVDKGVLLQTPCYGEQIDYVARAMKKWARPFCHHRPGQSLLWERPVHSGSGPGYSTGKLPRY